MQNRSKVAASLKAKGNGAYTKREYEKAAEYYTKAIEVSPTPEPVFYSNRAACALPDGLLLRACLMLPQVT